MHPCIVLKTRVIKILNMKKTLLVLVLAVLSMQINAQQDKKGAENTNKEKSLPDLTLSEVNGKQINVAKYGKADKITVIGFWATWCSPCKRELMNLSDIYEEWKLKYGLQVVAVSIDDAKSLGKVKAYLEGQKWGFDVLLDVNQDLKRALDLPSVPYIIVVDKKGKIVFTHSGYVEGDEYVLEQELQRLEK